MLHRTSSYKWGIVDVLLDTRLIQVVKRQCLVPDLLRRVPDVNKHVANSLLKVG